MQLLDTDQLEYAFQLHGITLEVEARKFYGDLWTLIQQAEKTHDASSLAACEHDLRLLCNNYFALTRTWMEDEEERYENLPGCPGARENAREALASLLTFEKQFFRYALCYMELNRALIQTKSHLAFFARHYKSDLSEKNIQVGDGTGDLLQRAYKNWHEVMEKRNRLERVRTILINLDPLMESLGKNLPKLMGHEQGDHQITIFKGTLRKKDFARARKVVLAWDSPKLVETGLAALEIAEKNVGDLQASDGIMLHSGELTLISSFLRSDEAKASQFLDKFNVPYMLFQYRALLHQGYVLGHVGSIEGLIIQHAKTISLASRLHNSPDQARLQEQAILVPMRTLLQTKFKTIGPIFDDMETIVATLQKIFAQTREYMNHTLPKSQN